MLEYFYDPVLRAPTIGSMLMCLGSSLVGVLAFLRKASLVGESLSHAAYPGVILGAIASGLLAPIDSGDLFFSASILAGAFLTAVLGVWSIFFLQRKLKIRPDSALCFVLASFFGFGILLASRVQMTHATLYVQSLSYLYGQAASMTDRHIWLYAALSLVIIVALIFLYKELLVIAFDADYARSLGIAVRTIDALLFLLIALAVVTGIRSVGVVMMSAMLIAPAVTARQFTHSLYKMLILAGFFGLLSAYLGNVLSIEGTRMLLAANPGQRIALPTGPMIVLAASFFAVFALLFSKERGLVFRYFRKLKFRGVCLKENILKALWRFGPDGQIVHMWQIASLHAASPLFIRMILFRLRMGGWIEKKSEGWNLTSDGKKKAAHIVRLHRLWELYLADYLGIGAAKVHKSAEQMEHILTPEIEKELSVLLHDPKFDPHYQPIPPMEGQ